MLRICCASKIADETGLSHQHWSKMVLPAWWLPAGLYTDAWKQKRAKAVCPTCPSSGQQHTQI
eukprot:4108593-Pyramimonas_sp.AAC.1